MNTSSVHIAPASMRRIGKLAICVAGLLVAVAAVSGCTQNLEAVCDSRPANVVVIASTSTSDLETSRKVAAEVGTEAVTRAANSCGTLSVGLLNNSPEADLELHSETLVPSVRQANDRRPVIKELVKRGDALVRKNLVELLATTEPTHGSPFLAGLVKVGEELKTHDMAPATIVLIGDLIAVEPTPSNDGMVDLRRGSVRQADLDAFVPGLKTLDGSCVITVTAGAASNLPDSTIVRARMSITRTLWKSGVGFAATRSTLLPASCPRG